VQDAIQWQQPMESMQSALARVSMDECDAAKYPMEGESERREGSSRSSSAIEASTKRESKRPPISLVGKDQHKRTTIHV
jgi:hypothetical protein